MMRRIAGRAEPRHSASLQKPAPPAIRNRRYSETREQAMADFKAQWLSARDASWQNTICAGVLAFLISMWIADFLFPNATRWCLK
jgi:hypothetical protein